MERRISEIFKKAGLFTLVVVLLALNGCNTIRGFGRDVEKGGEEIQEQATDAQH